MHFLQETNFEKSSIILRKKEKIFTTNLFLGTFILYSTIQMIKPLKVYNGALKSTVTKCSYSLARPNTRWKEKSLIKSYVV